MESSTKKLSRPITAVTVCVATLVFKTAKCFKQLCYNYTNFVYIILVQQLYLEVSMLANKMMCPYIFGQEHVRLRRRALGLVCGNVIPVAFNQSTTVLLLSAFIFKTEIHESAIIN